MYINKEMKLFVCPVSGGSFVQQIASTQRLSKINYKPDVCMGSSGGNISIYIAEASSWKYFAMSRLASRLTPCFLLKKHSENTIINGIKSFFRGSFFANGNGSDLFFENCINHIETDTEIWTGVFNSTRNVSEVVCNIEHSRFKCPNSIISPKNKLHLYSQASASIPVIVSPVVIDGMSYQDGGVSSASPLINFSTQITTSEEPIQMIYVSPLMNRKVDNEPDSMLGGVINTINSTIRCSITNDELLARSIMESRLPNYTEKSGRGIPLSLLKSLHKSNSEYFLLLKTSKEKSIDIESFTEDDVKNLIEECYDYTTYTILY